MNESDRRRAAELHEQAQQLDDDDALRMYQEVLALDPSRPQTHYNIGLIYKYRGGWRESFEHNRRSVALDESNEAANWNLAIAATALRDWVTAREVWHRLGFGIDLGDTPIEDDFGITPVRLNPDDNAEVVWGQRIDPVRVRIENVPYPESGFRCGDVVLHDGAPVGQRVFSGRTYPVFNVLALFEASKQGTWVAEVLADGAADVEALCQSLKESGAWAENWSRNVRLLCKQCSEGTPHETHDHALADKADGIHRIGVHPKDPQRAEQLLRKWDAGRGRLLSFECVLAVPSPH